MSGAHVVFCPRVDLSVALEVAGSRCAVVALAPVARERLLPSVGLALDTRQDKTRAGLLADVDVIKRRKLPLAPMSGLRA